LCYCKLCQAPQRNLEDLSHRTYYLLLGRSHLICVRDARFASWKYHFGFSIVLDFIQINCSLKRCCWYAQGLMHGCSEFLRCFELNLYIFLVSCRTLFFSDLCLPSIRMLILLVFRDLLFRRLTFYEILLAKYLYLVKCLACCLFSDVC
jgi:hypothetical protein